MTSHTRRVLELGVGLGLALTLVLTALADWHQRTAARVRADTIRLHILANSDTWDDQLLKLQVRDAVLAAIPEAVTRADTPQQAAAALQTALPALQNAADNALHRARGRNWFCVLYPALCLSGAQSDYPTKAENALVFGRYEVRFALAELVGRMASPEGLRPQARVGAQPPKAALSA